MQRSKVGVISDGQLIRLAMDAAQDCNQDVSIYGQSITASAVAKLLTTQRNLVWFVEIPHGDWENNLTLSEFASELGIWNPVTTEWENVSARVFMKLRRLWLIPRPDPIYLTFFQDRLLEKTLAKEAWLDTPWFRDIESLEDIKIALAEFWWEIIIKTRRSGYDGKWQYRVSNKTDIQTLWEEHLSQQVQTVGLIAEERIQNFEYEVSIIAGRAVDGSIQMFPPMLNIHENGILRYTVSPAPVTSFMAEHRVSERAQGIVKTFFEEINAQCPEGYVGLMAMELFITQDGRILFNEIAPRPHNSGHGTLDSHYTSQNHLWMSAVGGKPLDQTPEFRQYVIMENILSEAELAAVIDGKSRWQIPWVLYDYQKIAHQPKRNDRTQRKLAHINHFWEEINALIAEYTAWDISLQEVFSRVKTHDKSLMAAE